MYGAWRREKVSDLVSRPFIPIARPFTGAQEADAVRRVLASGWMTQGPEVAAFEAEFASCVGAPFACAVSSGTTALHLALLGAGVRPGDEVITVSHSFIATANAVRYCGATPVFVDIDPATYNIDPGLVDAAVGPRTRAILGVHQLGMPCDLAALAAIARRHGVPLVEDAACASGSELQWSGEWQRIGRPHGDVACFSFHPRKLVSTGDGGMIVTRDAALDRQFRLLRQHGMTTSDRERHAAAGVTIESYAMLGFNYRLTDIQAAIGREQLRRLPAMIERRRTLAAHYAERLAPVPGLLLPHEPSWARSNFQSYCVRLPDGCDQRSIMQRLLDQGIATRRGVMCAHREPAYATEPWIPGSSLRHSEEAQDRCVLLPLFHDMTDDDQARVTEALRGACVAAAV
jgi:dTDP-4-amino-4,6-dideoxygalactose transaminase